MKLFRGKSKEYPDPPKAWRGSRKVLMIRTVWSAEGELLGNREYHLSDEKADDMILHGYAEGELSREYSDDERRSYVDAVQEVQL